jgi:hypothetical protein
MKKTTKKVNTKPRNPIARDLLTPKYRQRVEINRKRAQKTGSSKSLISLEFFLQ